MKPDQSAQSGLPAFDAWAISHAAPARAGDNRGAERNQATTLEKVAIIASSVEWTLPGNCAAGRLLRDERRFSLHVHNFLDRAEEKDLDRRDFAPASACVRARSAAGFRSNTP